MANNKTGHDGVSSGPVIVPQKYFWWDGNKADFTFQFSPTTIFTILVTKSLRSYTQNDHPTKQKGGDIAINQWATCSSDGSHLENNVPKLYFYLISGEHVSRICKEIPEADSCLQSWNLQREEVGNVYLTPTPPIPIQWSRKLGWLWAEQGIKERTSQMPSSKGLSMQPGKPTLPKQGSQTHLRPKVQPVET